MGLKDEKQIQNDPNEQESEVEVSSEELTIAKTEDEPAPDSLVEESAGEITASDSVEEEEEEEEDLVDPMDGIKEGCQESSHCAKYKAELDRCTERVEGKESTTETCAQELYDFIHCVDHCVSKSLFSTMK